MKYEAATLLAALIGLSSAAPVANAPALPKRMLRGREVPQEHAHQDVIDLCNTNLQLNNPDNIQDCVFGLLGNAAAAAGQGDITNTDCLQQATADQCFTNAKAANDVASMTACLQYRALERNTGKVGLQSVLCTETAANAEVAALTQHQDPASDGAADTNKQIALTLAVQINSVGGNAQDALNAGTFAPGDVNDATAKGNTCDDANDTNGCIKTLNLLQSDASADEIDAAVASGGSADAGATASNSTASSGVASSNSTADSADSAEAAATSASAPCSVVTATVTATPAATGGSDAAASPTDAAAADITSQAAAAATEAADAAATTAASSDSAAASGNNVQTFTGDLGGLPPPVIDNVGAEREFSVNGDTFLNKGAAVQRSCAVQHNACANAVNSGSLAGGVGQCETQEQQCNAAGGA